MFKKPPPPKPNKFRQFKTLRRPRTAVQVVEGSVRRIGSAIIGGSYTGNPRGKSALDIQQAHGRAEHVASGVEAIALGRDNEASGPSAIALGDTNTASATSAVAIGSGCIASHDSAFAFGFEAEATGYYSNAIGQSPVATADYANAIGVYAKANVANTTNLTGPLIAQRGGSTTAANWFLRLGGAPIVLFSNPLDLKTVADYTITLPAGCKFWVNEVGLLLTHLTSLTVQPTIRFGRTGTLAAQLPATLTTLLTAVGRRERYAPLDPNTAETTLTCGLTVAATATTLKARFYWTGLLVEDE